MRATLIVGAGPGGTGPLVSATQKGVMKQWLDMGLSIVDAGASIGGTLDRYIINSDSLGGVYLECLEAAPGREVFGPLADDPSTHELERLRRGFPPLALVGRFLRRMGTTLEQAIACSSGGEFIPHTTVRALRFRSDGSIVAEMATADGHVSHIDARTAVMALGGHQDMEAYRNAQIVPGLRLADLAQDRVVPSDALLTAEGRSRAAAIVKSGRSRRIVILGGSHSGFSVAWVLTNLMPELDFRPGDIRILMRRQPPIYYESIEQADADDYPITPADLCPTTRRVNRLGGLRGDGRDIWRRITRRNGVVPETRVVMQMLTETEHSAAALRRDLEDVALIVPAFGYRTRTVPVFDARNRRIRLNADAGRTAVDADARVLRDDGRPLANLFCIGLGTGYRPSGSMGGEPNFTGQANSLWLYQNHIGGVVHRGVQHFLAKSGTKTIWPFGRFGALRRSIDAEALEPQSPIAAPILSQSSN